MIGLKLTKKKKKIKVASWLLDAFTNAPLQIRFNFMK